MLAKQGIISKKDASQIVKGLQAISREIESGTFRFSQELEDIHMNIEAALTERIGAAGGRLHTARSRNDQVALDLRLYLRDETRQIVSLLQKLTSVLAESASRNLDIIMPGFTHLQRAQPVLLSHHLMAYAQMFDRDRERWQDALKRINVLPLGACALAGTSLPIDRHYVAELLGFDAVSENSIDSVSDRDFAIEFVSCGAIFVMHASRLSEDLILWSSEEFSFATLPDAFTTGSSIMPQKKNPDVAELARGKAGRLIGNLAGLLATFKGLPLAYNRDLQEDKEPLFDGIDQLTLLLPAVAGMVATLEFDTERMAEVAPRGFSLATDVADWLVRHRVPFAEAHDIAGAVVRLCERQGCELADLTAGQLAGVDRRLEPEVMTVLTVSGSVTARDGKGGTAPDRVAEQLEVMSLAVQQAQAWSEDVPAGASD